MANRYYSFDYTEMIGSQVSNMGILSIHIDRSITTAQLKDHVKQHLKNPAGQIFITNINRITKDEFEISDSHKLQDI